MVRTRDCLQLYVGFCCVVSAGADRHHATVLLTAVCDEHYHCGCFWSQRTESKRREDAKEDDSERMKAIDTEDEGQRVDA